MRQISENIWQIDPLPPMRVPVRVFSSESLKKDLEETVFTQAKNVATLPGIVDASIIMPDAHSGYGFPIGGVGAFDPDEGGVVCMGGIGFDISCGVRTMTTGLAAKNVIPQKEKLIDELFKEVPAGLGEIGKLKVDKPTLEKIAVNGAFWAVENGFGTNRDLESTEEGGKVDGANPNAVSDFANRRQLDKMGTLGSGNHYLEVQIVEEIYLPEIAKKWEVEKDSVVITFHCGSRAYGHQIGTDYLKTLAQASQKYKIFLPDRELVCAPITSPEGEQFLGAVFSGINCALANRQIIAHLVRETIQKIFSSAKVETLYEVSHNTAKFEEHPVNGEKKKLLVHRKGATRAFKDQPVIVGGSMGTASYLLLGTGMEESFSTCIHGAGRTMSRTEAKRKWFGKKLVTDLRREGVIIKVHSYPGVAEEAPGAYKDVSVVVEAVDKIGLAKKVAKLRPIACIKG